MKNIIGLLMAACGVLLVGFFVYGFVQAVHVQQDREADMYRELLAPGVK